MEIAGRMHREVEPSVPTQLVEHVIEKWEPRRNIGYSRTIEVDFDLDRRFGGVPISASNPCRHDYIIPSLALIANLQEKRCSRLRYQLSNGAIPRVEATRNIFEHAHHGRAERST